MICHFVLHPTDPAGDKKMSRAAGWAPAGAARGTATTFYCGSLCVETKNCSKMPLLLPGRAAVKNRRAGTGEGISTDGECSHLWHF